MRGRGGTCSKCRWEQPEKVTPAAVSVCPKLQKNCRKGVGAEPSYREKCGCWTLLPRKVWVLNPLTAKSVGVEPLIIGRSLIWRNTLCNIPVVAAHLHPKMWLSLQGSTVLLKVDGFQSSLTKAYKVAALEVRALNATSLLMECQAKLEEELTALPNLDLWVEVSIMTSLCLHLH